MTSSQVGVPVPVRGERVREVSHANAQTGVPFLKRARMRIEIIGVVVWCAILWTLVRLIDFGEEDDS